MNGLQAPLGYEEIEKKKKLLTTPLPKLPPVPPGYENIPEGYEEVSKPKAQAQTYIQQRLMPPSKYRRESVFQIPAKGQKASNIVYQAARGFAEEAYLNIPKFPKPTELTEWEDVFEGAGRFVGFVFGLPMRMGKMGTQLLFKTLKKPINKVAGKVVKKKLPHVGRVLERVGQESFQLGLASAISDIEDVKGMPERFKGGATFGAIFGGASWAHIRKMPLLSQIIRQVGTRALARTANLYKLPYENIEQWKTPEAAQRVFDELLFSFFSAKSAKPAEIFRDLQQIQKEVVKSGLPIKVWSPYSDPVAQAAMKKIPAKFISLPSGEVIPAEMFSWKLDVTGIKKILPTLKALPEARITKRAEYEKRLKEMEVVSGRKPEEIKTWVEMRRQQKKEPTTRYEGALPEKGMLEVPKPFKTGKPELEYKYGGFDIGKMLENLETTLSRKHEAARADIEGKQRRVVAKQEEKAGLVEEQSFSAEQIISDALGVAGPKRREQERLFAEERGKRFTEAQKIGEEISGEAGFYAQKAKLEGELPKVDFESIRGKLTQEHVDAMFKKAHDSYKGPNPVLTYKESIRAGDGLAKLFGEKGGGVPQPKELDLLGKVFPKEMIQAIKEKRSRWEKIKPGLLEVANVPRALMASYDLSFGLRQGIFLAARYPKQFASSFLSQFKTLGSDKAFNALKEDIANRPTYELMRRGGGRKEELALTAMDAPLGKREEAFMGAALAEKIPIIGLGVRASNRAYTGFANKLRADVFDHLIKSSKKAGREPWKDPLLVDSIIRFVNAGSGRGGLKRLEKAAVNLNTVLFSPRLISSRLSLLNPKFYMKLDPFVRKQALQSLFAFTSMVMTTAGLAKLAGAEVSLDPRSADFLKIKIGNTRIDFMGGFQQYIRLAAQLISKTIVSTTTGKVTKLGEGYRAPTRATITLRGAEYKLAPVASFAVNLFRGRTTFGEPIETPKEIATEVGKRFVPMVMQDVIELAKEDPELLPLAIPGFFGAGIQTYGVKKKTRR
ncbi:MAG: hypothetical protein V3V81_08035 [Candidatus Bathyarchaeia archaeon]